MIMKNDHIVSSLQKLSFCCSLIMMSCYPVLRQEVRIWPKDSGRLDEKETDNLTDAVRQTRVDYSDRTNYLSRAKIYRTCRSSLVAEYFPVAPWQLCATVRTLTLAAVGGECIDGWMDFILLPLPPDLWRAWETFGSLFWMINIITPLQQFITTMHMVSTIKVQCE